MKYCEDHGDTLVVWDGRGDCPVCREIDELKWRVSELEKQVEKLEDAEAENE